MLLPIRVHKTHVHAPYQTFVFQPEKRKYIQIQGSLGTNHAETQINDHCGEIISPAEKAKANNNWGWFAKCTAYNNHMIPSNFEIDVEKKRKPFRSRNYENREVA